MIGEHAEIAFDPGHVHLLNIAGKQQFFRRNKLKMEIGHRLFPDQAASAASFLPFSTASSMVPTM